MNILLEQTYIIDNVISRSGKFTVAEFQEVLKEMEKSFKAYGVNKGESVITTTRAMEVVNNQRRPRPMILLMNCLFDMKHA